MTQQEFIKILKSKNYSYNIENNNIIIDHKEWVDLESLTSLLPNTQFNNEGFVELNSLTSLPPNTQFNNIGKVFLKNINSNMVISQVPEISPNKLIVKIASL